MENKTVYVYIDLFKLQEVDEKDGLWVAKLFLYYYYYSHSARWNSSDYNDGTLTAFFVPQGTFWTPDIV
ncbi:neuronal acetylcholine receptor subunit alpha-7-like isoform X1 [Convolutriloba macropyga]|uniref:neuronal acetylcholine receptor subunit alpha-7-like isoform X1 n=2 Tax=Convolutriloba macropyga TaxID=536237 RepID=UPI003F51F2C6